MSAGERVHPDVDAWVAAIHATQGDYEPLGSGIVIDDHRVLTCAHVVESLAREKPWVAFPKAVDDIPEARRLVERVVLPDDRTPVKDLAILVLSQPLPAGVTHAPLRCPEPTAMVTKRWWAFGFPAGDPLGNSADGQVGSSLSSGWIRLDTASRYRLERGFSGGGLWSPDYQAVVAIISHFDAARGDGRAITLHQADQWFPGQDLRTLAEQYAATAAGPLALAAWGWSLQGDSEATRHWRPRARGVSVDSERGYRFRGRTAALRAITSWLDRQSTDRRVLVVTGAPGAGKSAILGRIVTTADKGAVRELPAGDTAVRATAGSVACAVHAKGQTALEIAQQIAKAASAVIPDRIEDFPAALRDVLTERTGSRFNVIIDALDEAVTPGEARAVITKVILPLAETCADIGAQIAVGTRRADTDGGLLAAFGAAASLIDLDTPAYFAPEDLVAYARAVLQRDGHEHAGNPYADDKVAAPVAERIASLSNGNFLVAGLTAYSHALYDQIPADPARVHFSPKVDVAMRDYLSRIQDVAGVSAQALLLALAYAESPGLPVSLWRTAVRALGFGDVAETVLRRFARSAAASFLVESTGGDGTGAEFRLFHQALNDALLSARSALAESREDEQALVRAFMQAGQEVAWDHAPGYLLRSLPAHAARAGLMDGLLADDSYLLHADLLRLQPLAHRVTSAAGRQRAQLLRLSSRAVISADAASRAAMFSVTEVLEDLGDAYTRARTQSPYRASWTSAPPSPEHSVLWGHSRQVTAICAFTLNGRSHLATTDGGTVRIWDPSAGTQQAAIGGRINAVSICAYTDQVRTYLAAGDSSGVIHVWDPVTGVRKATLESHAHAARVICAFTVNGKAYLASSGEGDGTVRIWDPAASAQVRALTGLDTPVWAICSFTVDGRTYLAAGGNDQIVRIWDAVTGSLASGPDDPESGGHLSGPVLAIAAYTHDGRVYLAVGGRYDGTIRIWDAATGALRATLKGHSRQISVISVFTLNGGTCLATGGGIFSGGGPGDSDGTVRIWDAVTGTLLATFEGHVGQLRALSAFEMDGRAYIATGGAFGGSVPIWDPDTFQGDTRRRQVAWVRALSPYTGERHFYLAVGGTERTICIFEATTGAAHVTIDGHTRTVNAICAFPLNGQTHLAVGGGDAVSDGTVRIYNAVTGSYVSSLSGHSSSVEATCAFSLNGRIHVATGDSEGIVRIWNPATGRLHTTFTGNTVTVQAIRAFTHAGRTYLAIGGGGGRLVSPDGAVRIWDPVAGTVRRAFDTPNINVGFIGAFALNGSTRLAILGGFREHAIHLWDPISGTRHAILEGHTESPIDVCAFDYRGRTYLASASEDRTVRIWDAAKEATVLVIPTRDSAASVAYADGLLFIGTSTGVLTIRLDVITPNYIPEARRGRTLA